jgi:hypothetical protein
MSMVLIQVCSVHHLGGSTTVMIVMAFGITMKRTKVLCRRLWVCDVASTHGVPDWEMWCRRRNCIPSYCLGNVWIENRSSHVTMVSSNYHGLFRQSINYWETLGYRMGNNVYWKSFFDWGYHDVVSSLKFHLLNKEFGLITLCITKFIFIIMSCK